MDVVCSVHSHVVCSVHARGRQKSSSSASAGYLARVHALHVLVAVTRLGKGRFAKVAPVLTLLVVDRSNVFVQRPSLTKCSVALLAHERPTTEMNCLGVLHDVTSVTETSVTALTPIESLRLAMDTTSVGLHISWLPEKLAAVATWVARSPP
eukprot:TRINITY_DN4808_c0_g1_i1.p4 TRINITY_DN4808_c0_g1~~TRINITY_DN4808_c0_g1_i1.p4  ORF type:complete len:152 (-),score=7.06 TRINITY_DN4808_c0_g1_i1:2358-2813(-)